MKKTEKILMALLAVLSMAFISCSDDDDNNNVMPTPSKQELKFDTDTLQIGVGETANFNITAGGGDYKVYSLNPEIASVENNGNVVTVTSMEKGWTSIVVSDADGNYKRVVVRSMYLNMALDKDNVTVKIKLGHKDGVETVNVTAGNGGYTAESADKEICTTSVSDNVISIHAVKEGTTTVSVKDQMGLTKTITVNVEVTTEPFTDSELEAIKSITTNNFKWENNEDYGPEYGTFSITDTSGRKFAQWDYYDYYFIKVWFDGDLSVGKKTGGKVHSKRSWSGSGDIYEDCDVEIIKNDGSRIWGIMSKVQNNYLYTGYFCVTL